MVHLVLKDLLIQKKSFLFTFLYSFFLFVVFNNEIFREFVYVMGGVITTYMFLITANTNDETIRSEIVLGSLPVRRNTIVAAKYVGVFIYVAIGMATLTLAALLLQLLPLPIPVPRLLTGMDILFVLTLITIAATLYFPLYFKFGSAAIRTFSVLFFLAFFFLPRILTEQYLAGNFNIVLDVFLELSGILTWLPGMIVSFFLIVVYMISMKYSQRIYSLKDL